MSHAAVAAVSRLVRRFQTVVFIVLVEESEPLQTSVAVGLLVFDQDWPVDRKLVDLDSVLLPGFERLGSSVGLLLLLEHLLLLLQVVLEHRLFVDGRQTDFSLHATLLHGVHCNLRYQLFNDGALHGGSFNPAEI